MDFPFSLPAVPEHGGDLPAAADVVVIGGGVAGVSAALFLRRKGLSVLLLEKGRLAAEQSSRNWGWVRVQGRHPAEIPIALEARGLWQDLNQRAGGRMGVKTVGVTYLADTDKEIEGFHDWLKLAEPYQLDSHFKDRADTAAFLPGSTHGWAGAMVTPSDMKAEPWQAVPEIGRMAAEEGVTVREACAARALDLQAGRVTGVHTEAGLVRTNAVVLAAGAWSRLFLKRHGVTIPQLSVRSSAMATEPLPEVHGGAAADGAMSFRRRADGGYTVTPAGYSELFVGPDAFASLRAYLPVILRPGEFDYHLRGPAPRGYPDAWSTPRRWAEDAASPFEAMRILNPAPNLRKLEEIRARFARTFPDLGAVKVRTRWAGMIDALPDLMPVVDQVASLPGLTVCTGLSGHGFGIGPAYGRILSEMVAGGNPGHDLHDMRMSRFSDGSKLVPVGGI